MNISNFKLVNIAIGIEGTDYAFNINQLLSLKYTESIKSASIRIEVQLTDTRDGILSALQGMEPIYFEFEDHKENTFSTNLVVYDIQDRVVVDGKSKASLLCCSPDLVNNASAKISRLSLSPDRPQFKAIQIKNFTQLSTVHRGSKLSLC